MHIAFHSSHVDGDYSDGKLHLRVAPDIVQGLAPRVDAIWFTRAGRLSHPQRQCRRGTNDAGRPALSGRNVQLPHFALCADTLAWYYQLDEIGPVDDALEPRRPGRFLALNFSGGLDSTAIWVLLRDLAKVTFKVVTSEYGHPLLDRPGYSDYQRDSRPKLTCAGSATICDGRFN